MMQKVRIGFLGAGDISNLHASGVNKCGRAELMGLWNRAECPIVSSPQDKAAEYGCRLFESAEELCASSDIDVVYVLTNMETHLQYATLAMQNGKHVLVEKPVGSSVAEIEQMIAIAEENNVLCIPGHNYIHESQIERMKDMIDSKQIGNVTQIYIMYNIHHPENVCDRLPNIIRQIVTHHGYITLYLLGDALGPPTTVSAMGATINDGSVDRWNLAHMTVQFGSSGALGHLQASFANDDHTSSPWSFVIKVQGTKGACSYNYNDFVINEKHIVHSHTYASYPYAVEAETEYLVDKILGCGAAPKSSMQDAIVCQKLIEASERSITERRHVGLDEI